MNTKILVIDDDPSIVHLMTSNLEDQGYEVVSGYDGQMAIQLARTQMPHLIIMDVNMPMTNGLMALESIRRNEFTKLIPIILVTGETSERVFPLVNSTERVMHIKKPVDLEEMNSLIRQVLQQYPPE